MEHNELLALIESLIFAAPEPLQPAQIQEVLAKSEHPVEAQSIDQALLELESRWNESVLPAHRGFMLCKIAGGYVFRTYPEHGKYIRLLLSEKPQKLSQSHLEVLAIIAYRQPVTRIEVEEIRGVDSSGAIKKLLALSLVKILGKSDGMGRPLLYGTSKRFLEHFGLNSLHDLPSLKEYDDLGKLSEADKAAIHQQTALHLDDLMGGDASLLTPATEELSEDALDSLEKALGVVKQATGALEESPPVGSFDELSPSA